MKENGLPKIREDGLMHLQVKESAWTTISKIGTLGKIGVAMPITRKTETLIELAPSGVHKLA